MTRRQAVANFVVAGLLMLAWVAVVWAGMSELGDEPPPCTDQSTSVCVGPPVDH